MKPVIMKQHIQGNRLHYNKDEEIKIAPDKKKNISHLIVFLQFYSLNTAGKNALAGDVESAIVLLSHYKGIALIIFKRNARSSYHAF